MAEKVIRKRGWFIERNWDYDRNDPTSKYHGVDEDTWREGVLEEWTELAQEKKVDWCHFIFHDSDVLIDKKTNQHKIKPIHAHAVVRYVDSKTQNTVMKAFCGSNQRSENCQWIDPQKGGFRQALLYLTHQTSSAYNAEKTWYHHSDVHQFGKRYLDLIKTDSKDRRNKQDLENTVNEFVEKVMEGEMKLSVAKAQFKELEGASALVKYRDSFEKAFDEFKGFKVKEMRRKSGLGQFRKRTTYISGAGRTGKSVLAECLATDRYGVDDVYTAPSGGSNKITTDFVDGYETETATIFGDIEPTEYGYRAFYNMFDPYKWSQTKSRNSNKPWLSTECYIAVNYSLGDFIIQMINGDSRKELVMSEDNADKLIMGFGRVEHILQYGMDDNGNAVVWVGKLKSDLPSKDDVIDYAKTNLRNMFNSKIVGAFYDTLGYVPYDKVAPIFEERTRIAQIINAVYDGDLNANGFVRI